MRVVVLIPYRPGEPERERNWEFVRNWWDGWEVFTGDSGTPAFSCGSSCNRASEAAGDWDVAICTDADVALGSQKQARAAVKLAADTGSFVVAYSDLYYLDAVESERVCSGVVSLSNAKPWHGVGNTWIGTFMMRRDLWDTIGGYDERFVGYGVEDIAIYRAAATMGGAARNPGTLYHLDHPERPEPPNEKNWAVNNEYGWASWDKELMAKVLAREVE